MRSIFKLYRFVKPYRLYSIVALILLLGMVASDLLIPRLTQRIIDQGIVSGDLRVVWSTALVMLGAALLSALLLAGFLWWLFDRRRPRLASAQRSGLILLLASSSFTLLVFLWYNLTFVQHQGRYLFPALIPIGTAAALGLSILTRTFPDRVGAWTTASFFAGMALLDVYCLFRFIIPFLAR